MDQVTKPVRRCTRCGAALRNSAGGLCAGCLLQGALATWTEEDAAAEGAAKLIRRRRLGGYELIDEVARGGMGMVFRARQKNPSRVVALKVISSGELATPRMVERFNNEALAAARLSHPNIVPIYEVGEDRGWHFFSMEFVEGRTLADLVRDEAPTPAMAAGLMIKIARAVEHAHQRGVLHRDLKPANILLDRNNEPRLTDFGLAKIAEQETDITRTHAVLGSPAYMSPEQAAGKSRDITTASDVYSLGTILYELLAGRPPFSSETTPALLRKIMDEEPPPLLKKARSRSSAQLQSAASHFSDLTVICFKCLEKLPLKRYATAGDLADELERWQRGEPIFARPAGAWERSIKWARRHPAWTVLGGMTALAGFVLTFVSLFFNIRLDRARNIAEQNAARHRTQLVREHLGEAGRAAEAGNGLIGLFALANALRLEGEGTPEAVAIRRRLGLTLRASPELLRLWSAGGSPYLMKFSSDNRHLAVGLRDGGLRVWNLLDGAVTAIEPREGERSMGIAFSPDGRLAAESVNAAPFVRVRQLENASAAPRSLPLTQPCDEAVAFSGGGRWLVTGGDRLRIWETGTWKEMPLNDNAEGPWIRIVGSPDDRLILALTPNGTGRLLDTTIWRWWETDEEISSPSKTMPCFSDDGRWLITIRDFVMTLRETETGREVFSTPYSFVIYSPAFSPDGRLFAAPSFRDQARVWSLPSAGNSEVKAFGTPIRHETGANQTVFSPDGRLLVTAGYDYQLRILHAGRHQLAAPVLHHTALVEAVAFSADGGLLASADAKGLVRVWNLRARGVITLAGVPAKPEAVFTADGKQLVARDGQDRLRVFDATSGVGIGEPLYNGDLETHRESAAAEPGQGHWGAPMDLSLDASKRFLAAAVGSHGVRIWELATRKLVASWTNVGEVFSVAFDPKGTALATGDGIGQVVIRSVSTGREIGKCLTEQAQVKRLAWSPSGQWLAAGSDQEIEVWDAPTMTRIGNLPARDRLAAMRFSREGGRILTAAGNKGIIPGSARLWELPSLDSTLPPMEHGDGVASAALSSDGLWVATGGEDNVVRLWHAASALPASRAMRHEAIIWALDFDSTSRWLAVVSNSRDLRIWNIPRGDLSGPVLPLDSSAFAVMFSPDSERIFIGTDQRNSVLVSFAPDPSSLEEIERTARGQTALRSGLDGALETATLSALVTDFGTRLPSGEIFTNAVQAAQWHESLAVASEATGGWFTAEFHLRWLSRLRPNDETFRFRLERAQNEQRRTLTRH